MTARLVREATTAAYHLRAEEAAAQAEANILDHVREKHEIAATRWRALAAPNEAGDPSRGRAEACGRANGGNTDHREETLCIA